MLDISTKHTILNVDKDHKRLDRFLLSSLTHLSRKTIDRLISNGTIRVNGRKIAKGSPLKSGDTIVIENTPLDEYPLPQPDLKLDIIAEDTNYIVINKYPNIHCHPQIPGERNTIANGIVSLYPECRHASENPREAGLVHRLDYSTSGALIAARNLQTYKDLREAFSTKKVKKEYLALVHGRLDSVQHIDKALTTDKANPKRVIVSFDGLEAISAVYPLAYLEHNTSLIRVKTRSGRRHQVRAHLAAIGHPLVGDALYGGKDILNIKSTFLHASHIEIEKRSFGANLPIIRTNELIALGCDPKIWVE